MVFFQVWHTDRILDMSPITERRTVLWTSSNPWNPLLKRNKNRKWNFGIWQLDMNELVDRLKFFIDVVLKKLRCFLHAEYQCRRMPLSNVADGSNFDAKFTFFRRVSTKILRLPNRNTGKRVVEAIRIHQLPMRDDRLLAPRWNFACLWDVTVKLCRWKKFRFKFSFYRRFSTWILYLTIMRIVGWISRRK